MNVYKSNYLRNLKLILEDRSVSLSSWGQTLWARTCWRINNYTYHYRRGDETSTAYFGVFNHCFGTRYPTVSILNCFTLNLLIYFPDSTQLNCHDYFTISPFISLITQIINLVPEIDFVIVLGTGGIKVDIFKFIYFLFLDSIYWRAQAGKWPWNDK